MTNSETSPTPRPPAAVDARFAYIVGLLLLVIIAALVGWMLQLRQRAITAEGDSRVLEARLIQYEKALKLLTMGTMTSAPLIHRDTLPRAAVSLNGQPTILMELDARTGNLLGLAPGDVIRIAPAPASQPASQPAPQPEAAP